MLISFLDSKGMTPYARVFAHLSQKQSNKQTLLQFEYPARALDIMKNEVPLMKALPAEDWSVELFESPLPEKPAENPIKYIALIESLQHFEVSIESLESILSHMTSTSSLNMIAKIASKNCSTLEQCEKVLETV